MSPTLFAEFLMFLGRLFNNAYLIIEANGPLGQMCVKAVTRQGYSNLYYRNRDKRAYDDKTEQPGFWHQDGGIMMLDELQHGMRQGKVHLNSLLTLRELAQYFMKGGKLVHAAEQNTQDEAGKGKSHGDIGIAAAVAYQGMLDQPAAKPEEVEAGSQSDGAPPEGSYGYRMRQRQQRLEQQGRMSYWSPSYF